ncbi:YlbD family protein [Lentibacillus halophilus]|uniref:YlbD family protein n=1 Tax=Lentibacillus halophilus TaxID=295065 RepID=UPI0031D8B6B1
MSENLHPSVKDFKDFLQRHPTLVEKVRRSGKGWQETYEKWALLGEDDPMWDKYRGKQESTSTPKDGKREIMDRLIHMSENIDMDKFQSQVDNINSAISTVQELLHQFQPSDQSHRQPFGSSFRNTNRPFGGFRD